MARRVIHAIRTSLAHPQFVVGVREMASVAPGIAAWGVMTGAAMADSGLSMVAVLMMAVIVFAGSSQLATLPLLAAGAPTWVVLATSFCVNLRFVVFSIHQRPYVMHQPRARRLFSGYLFADLNYVLFVRRFPTPARDPDEVAAQDAYWLGSGLSGWLTWTITGLAGVALAASIPPSWGLGFAGILALFGILCSLATTTLRAAAATISVAASVAVYALPLRLNIIVAIATAVALTTFLQAGTAKREARS